MKKSELLNLLVRIYPTNIVHKFGNHYSFKRGKYIHEYILDFIEWYKSNYVENSNAS